MFSIIFLITLMILRFLLYEVRPATSHEINALKNLQLLFIDPPWKRKIHKYISDMKHNQSSTVSAKFSKVINIVLKVFYTF